MLALHRTVAYRKRTQSESCELADGTHSEHPGTQRTAAGALPPYHSDCYSSEGFQAARLARSSVERQLSFLMLHLIVILLWQNCMSCASVEASGRASAVHCGIRRIYIVNCSLDAGLPGCLPSRGETRLDASREASVPTTSVKIPHAVRQRSALCTLASRHWHP